uniref:Uncharacterized protein n=1 Tax=Anguilla anguilla TaxID=7936 RepID=A0A0E9WTR4_ANGAN
MLHTAERQTSLHSLSPQYLQIYSAVKLCTASAWCG